jgi:hypothetical protein
MTMPPLRIPALLSLALLLPASHAQTAQSSQLANCPVNPISATHDCTFGTFTFDRAPSSTGRGEEIAHRTFLTATGPGLSLGNFGGWRIQHVTLDSLNVASRGIAQGRTLFFYKHAAGDTMGTYDYVYSDGGSTAASDEAIKGEAVDMGETSGYFHGTLDATTGPGDIAPVLHFVSGNNWTTDGAPLLDISKGKLSGHITGPSTPLPGSAYLNTFPVDNTLPLTTAWGICADPIPNNKLPATNTHFTCIVTLKQGRFEPKGLVCVTGPNYPEQAPILAAESPTGNTQSITLSVRNPNAAGATILQGGPCGQYISFDANLALTGYRSTYYAFGALDPHHLIYGMNVRGNLAGNTLPIQGGEAEQFGVSGFNGYHLYPGCEVVTNRTFGASPICEPNAVHWATGDLVEAPHNVAVNTVGRFTDVLQNTPTNGSLSAGDLLQIHGPGASGRAFIAHRTLNANPNTLYKPFGGPLDAPDLHRIEGYFDNGIVFIQAPGTLFRISNNAAHPNAPITLFSLPGGEIKWNPATHTLLTRTGLRGATSPIGGAPLALGACATGTATIPGADRSMVPVTVASTLGAPGFSPAGAFQVDAQVTAPDTVTVDVCAILPGTPRPSTYIVSLQ